MSINTSTTFGGYVGHVISGVDSRDHHRPGQATVPRLSPGIMWNATPMADSRHFLGPRANIVRQALERHINPMVIITKACFDASVEDRKRCACSWFVPEPTAGWTANSPPIFVFGMSHENLEREAIAALGETRRGLLECPTRRWEGARPFTSAELPLHPGELPLVGHMNRHVRGPRESPTTRPRRKEAAIGYKGVITTCIAVKRQCTNFQLRPEQDQIGNPFAKVELFPDWLPAVSSLVKRGVLPRIFITKAWLETHDDEDRARNGEVWFYPESAVDDYTPDGRFPTFVFSMAREDIRDMLGDSWMNLWVYIYDRS